jgi:hypothetical protein
MALARLFYHPRAEIEPHAPRGLQRRQRVADAATDLENPRTLRNDEAQKAVVLLVKEGRLLALLGAASRHLVGVVENKAFRRRQDRGHHNACSAGFLLVRRRVSAAATCPAGMSEAGRSVAGWTPESPIQKFTRVCSVLRFVA